MDQMGTAISKCHRASALLSVMTLGSVALAGCGAQHATGSSDAGSGSSGQAAPSPQPQRTEVGALTPRIVLAHTGGVTTLDSASGETVGSQKLEGFIRLNPAGDGRHVMVSGSDNVTALDTGLIRRAHGDHFHYFTQAPSLTAATIPAPEPGHVVVHGDRTAVFSDGQGAASIFDPASLESGTLGTLQRVATTAPHHGVAVPLSDGAVLHTEGTVDGRHSVVVQDAQGAEIARTDDCPGVHGEAAAKPLDGKDVITLGCENGPVVYRDGVFHKVVAKGYQRTGNQKGSEKSSIVLTDLNTDKDATEDKPEHPTSIGLLDTRTDRLKTVDLGSSYWFRSLDRGPKGEALVLTYDGKLRFLDPRTGKTLHEVKAVTPWTEPRQWQQPGPMLAVADGTAFVVDPAAKKLTMIDVASGKAYRTLDLPVVPHEIQVTTGEASGEVDVSGGHDEHDGHDHDHDGHDEHEGAATTKG